MLKKSICVSLCVISVLLSFNVNAVALGDGDLSAVGAVVYCKETGEVIFEKNSSKTLSMASTTKIMTSLIALECHTPYMVVEITDSMANVEGSSSGLCVGDKITLIDLVYCMLLESGNDAANAVALAVGGSFEQFAVMMNEKAAELKMENTSFVTPSGLDDENHYTTPYDMALLTSYALDNEEFVSICSQASYTVSFVDSQKQVTLSNHNRLLGEYDGCIGVKTGYTKKSGRCLVSAAKRNGVTIIAVTLNAGDDWNDHKKMLDYGFSCMDTIDADTDFSAYSVSVVGSDTTYVSVEGSDCSLPFIKGNEPDIRREVYLEKFLYAPVEKGDVVGYARYYNGDELIAEVNLTAVDSADVKIIEKTNLLDRLLGLLDRWWNNGG